MKLVTFCPGEGSRFAVAADVVSDAEARPFGGGGHTVVVLFGMFGESERVGACLFERDARRHPWLDPEKVAKRYRLAGAELTAAVHAIAFVLGREPLDPAYTPEQLDWDPDWRDQLRPVVEYLDAGGVGNAVHPVPQGTSRIITVTRAHVDQALALIEACDTDRYGADPVAFALRESFAYPHIWNQGGWLEVNGRNVTNDGLSEPLIAFGRAFYAVAGRLYEGSEPGTFTDAERQALRALVPFTFEFDYYGIPGLWPGAEPESEATR